MVTSLGICTCPKGENGSGCAHQAAVALKYGRGNTNVIQRSGQDRYVLAVLAIGDNPQLKFGQFVQLHEKSESVTNFKNEDRNEIETIPQQNMVKCMEENKEQQHDVMMVIGHKEEEPVAFKDILKLHHEVAADIDLKIRNKDNNFKKCYYNFLRTYRKIATKCRGQSPVASLASAFVHFIKQQSSNLISVLHNGSRI